MVCVLVIGVSVIALTTSLAETRPLSARAWGEATRVADDAVDVSWPMPDGSQRTARVAVTDPGSVVGRVPVAYDPQDPARAVVPGAALLVRADRASSGIAFGGLVLVGVAALTLTRLASWARVARRPARTARVRRVRVHRGLLARTWLETEDEPRRWIPVAFDPVLVVIPSPTEVLLHGDPLRDRTVAARVGAAWLPPSGRVATHEPGGRVIDFPTRPDETAAVRAAVTGRPLRQLRMDAVLVVPAPVVGLLWAYLDGGGFPVWVAATAVAAALGLWWAAFRGSDPS
ncbi:hypothetical protein GCM10012275_11150 [Longimycelium tulufanense]|uniref:Uncharacterized protein n=1 Tax=Longimycelium tulufanense TaxID=907463 RepID=A0A8J3C6M2_9PSEU|nr:hypothetical protein GCM10012275_11150 [Longimycelium tulufanense]